MSSPTFLGDCGREGGGPRGQRAALGERELYVAESASGPSSPPTRRSDSPCRTARARPDSGTPRRARCLVPPTVALPAQPGKVPPPPPPPILVVVVAPHGRVEGARWSCRVCVDSRDRGDRSSGQGRTRPVCESRGQLESGEWLSRSRQRGTGTHADLATGGPEVDDLRRRATRGWRAVVSGWSLAGTNSTSTWAREGSVGARRRWSGCRGRGLTLISVGSILGAISLSDLRSEQSWRRGEVEPVGLGRARPRPARLALLLTPSHARLGIYCPVYASRLLCSSLSLSLAALAAPPSGSALAHLVLPARRLSTSQRSLQWLCLLSASPISSRGISSLCWRSSGLLPCACVPALARYGPLRVHDRLSRLPLRSSRVETRRSSCTRRTGGSSVRRAHSLVMTAPWSGPNGVTGRARVRPGGAAA